MKSITAEALKEKMESGDDFQLIDVREHEEHLVFNLKGLLIPMGDIMQKYELIDRNKPVIFYCRKGIRSQIVIQRLQDKFQFDNLYNLVGGTEAWQKKFYL